MTEDNDLNTIALAFGLVGIQWGIAEQQLDLCVANIWQDFDCRHHTKNNKIPMMLKPKLEFLRKCFATTQELQPYQALAESVFTEFDRLSGLRHDMTHGAIAALESVEGFFVLNKLDIKDGFHHLREVRIPIVDYPKLTNDLNSLGRNGLKLAKSVSRVKHPR